MVEIWKDIEGYFGLYQVSSLGRVKSLNYNRTGKERILKAGKCNGYLRVVLCKEGEIKNHFVHRLVAIAFLPNPNNYPQINHRDEDKTNNTIQNLQWCSSQYNINYGTRNKRMSESLTNNPKRSKKVLCVETGVIYISTHQVEREFEFSKGHISKVCTGKRKTCGGFHWIYI